MPLVKDEPSVTELPEAADTEQPTEQPADIDTLSELKQMKSKVDEFANKIHQIRTEIKTVPQDLGDILSSVEKSIRKFNIAYKINDLDKIRENYSVIEELEKQLHEGNVKSADNQSLKRWLKRQRRSIFKDNRDSLILTVSDNLNNSLNAINSLQDLVERKGLSYIDLEQKVKDLTKSLGESFSYLLSLANLYNTELRNSPKKGTTAISETELRKLRKMTITWGGDAR